MSVIPPSIEVRQSVSKPEVGNEDRGIPIARCRAIRCSVVAPKGMTLNSEFHVRLYMRHAASKRVIAINGTLQSDSQPQGLCGDLYVNEAFSLGEEGVVAAEIPVHGDVGDELIPLVSGASCVGEPLDPNDSAVVYVYLERLGEF